MKKQPFPLQPTFHELNRGVDPEVAADIGYFVPGISDAPVTDKDTSHRAELPHVLEDPAENAAWHEQQARVGAQRSTVGSAAGNLSVAQQNANEGRAIAKHIRTVNKQILDY